MCEVVDISDDEDSFLLEKDIGVVPKDESLDYDLPPQITCPTPRVEDVASSSGSALRSLFIGMGFKPSLVDKAIEEKGEGNTELILETLFAYTEPKPEVSHDGFSSMHNDSFAANLHAGEDFHKSESSESLGRLFGENAKENVYCEIASSVKVEHDVGGSVHDEKTASLLKMNFTLDEVGFAMHRLGKDASVGQLMDFIFAARMAKKYEKDTNNPFPGNEETEKVCKFITCHDLSKPVIFIPFGEGNSLQRATDDSNNEVLFGIMEKSLQLLEMGFSENDISEAFERCGSDATTALLAESIVTGGTCPLPVKVSTPSQYPSTCLDTLTLPRNSQSLKRKTGDLNPVRIKTEVQSSDPVAQVGTLALLEKLKGKMPEVDTDEPNILKKPKDEFIETSGDWTWLEARIGNNPSASNPALVLPRRAGRVSSLEDNDRKPTLSTLNPSRSLSNVVAKPPYFLYGNVTSLSLDSWAKISQFLYSIQPEVVDSQSFSALVRKEGYVHNLPNEDRFHISPKGPMTIAEAIPHARKWWPSWDNRKHLSYISCESTGLPYLCEKFGRMVAEANGLPSAELQKNILQQCLSKNLVWVGKHKLAPLEPEHLEHIMGYPVHHTRIAGYTSSDRIKALKLSFQTDTLAYHLSALKRLFPGGVTVLSFFTGIGGAEVALHRLGIRLKGVVSVEPCEMKRRMLKKWWEGSAQSGELIQLESISKLTSSKMDDLFKKFKGFELVVCQNPYSGADSDNLAGLDFSMFVEFVRILQRVRSTMDRK